MSSLFRPAVHPTKDGLMLIDYTGNQMVVHDSEVERFIEDFQEVRKQQLIRHCRDIAGCRNLVPVDGPKEGGG